MASITSSGVGSGIDIKSLVSQLITAERTPADNRLNQREAALQTRISALGGFKSALSTFQSSLSSIKNTATFQASTKATVGNDKLFTASASSTAPSGSYSVKVENLAQSQKLATDPALNIQQDPDQYVVGTGTLTFQFGTYDSGGNTFTANANKAVKTVTIDSSNNSLNGVAKAINDAKIGVTANVINDGSGWRLTLGSNDTGAANSLKITTVDGDSNNTDAAGLSILAYDPTKTAGAGKNMQQPAGQEAKDASVIIDGLTVTSASNTLNQAIQGVTLNLTAADTTTATTLTVAKDNSAISSGVQSFVKAFNDLASTVKSLTSYNAETKESGALQGDFSVRAIFGQIRSELNKTVTGSSTQFDSLADLGISTNRDGTLAIDSTKLQEAIDTDAQGVAGLFAKAGRTSDRLVNYSSSTSESRVGSYAVAVSQLATQGNYLGTAVGTGPFTIDANNNTFALKVNGAQSSTLTLTAGSYTSSQLVAELQSRINGDSTLQGAGASIGVSFSSTTSMFSFTSSSYGSTSAVEFTAVGASTQATLGFSVGAGVAGQDVQGTIGGTDATGSGRKLTGTGGGATGLAVEVVGGATGDRGTVSLSDGLATRLDTLLSGLLGSNSPLTARTDSLNQQVTRISDQRTTLNDRMTALEKRYSTQFQAMDALISQLTTTSNYLTQQFSSNSSSK